ncbi:phospholipase/carboxylesterase [Pseudomassariella vexata]|uniref:Phospholipase/carboxylesterase n=1 Tax=Pseudomassariella vexata TaxID=1141098 RepID=A0A1Y2DD07_9PEZI|nr:phospholipase/carboxylesterase [Pseudomassariella vexata]ORY57148.1 phospholipase/carboxylesterase [Pseudomassariella vexata]
MASLIQDKTRLTWAAITLGGIPILSYAITSYRAWLRLGPGGLPYNVFGFFINSALHLIARSDIRAPAPYNPDDLAPLYGPGGTSYFENGTLPSARSGSRPNVPGAVAPQRQMTEQATQETHQQMKDFLVALVKENADFLQLKPSGLENASQQAAFLADGFAIPGHMKGTRGEFLHPHEEGSSHVVLGLSDSARLIELGWAERHKLSGVIIPWGYVLVYAPRNAEELGVWKSIVIASAKFVAAGGPKVRVPQ